jgi:adenine-specific DNA methylase
LQRVTLALDKVKAWRGAFKRRPWAPVSLARAQTLAQIAPRDTPLTDFQSHRPSAESTPPGSSPHYRKSPRFVAVAIAGIDKGRQSDRGELEGQHHGDGWYGMIYDMTLLAINTADKILSNWKRKIWRTSRNFKLHDPDRTVGSQ